MALITRILFQAALMLLLIPACSNTSGSESSANAAVDGKAIYQSNCSMCHGRYGNAGVSGAGDLTVSTSPIEDVISTIRDGKGEMLPYGEQLSKKQIEAVAEYVISLRK